MKLIKILNGIFKSIKFPLISFSVITDANSKISKLSKINILVRFYNSTIDEYSYIGQESRIVNSDIGKFSSISWSCSIGLASHNIKSLSTSPIFFNKNNGTGIVWVEKDFDVATKRTLIGNDVWIGANAIVMAGVKIADGAIVGAGAVVTKDVSPFTIVAGVPAKIIGKRFDDACIKRLIEIKWWNQPVDEIKKFLDFFQKSDITIDDIENFSMKMKLNKEN